jgi:hypothetical protein
MVKMSFELLNSHDQELRLDSLFKIQQQNTLEKLRNLSLGTGP